MTDQEKLALLQPDFARLIVKLMDAVKRRGFELMVTQGLRTFDEQNALFAKGRTKQGPIVTNAKGGESYHNYGLAVDLALKEMVNGTHFPDPHPVWGVIGEEARKLGLTWGGNFKTIKDRPHVEAPIALADVRKWYDKAGREGVWAQIATVLQQKQAADESMAG